VGWTVDTLGWQATSGGRSGDSVVHRVLVAAAPGEIVLIHVGSHLSDHSMLDALPRVISGLCAAGYGSAVLQAWAPADPKQPRRDRAGAITQVQSNFSACRPCTAAQPVKP
jgi:peptidoglycan/xylan/chitin deacetylase (PgdA/CDA1 family)